MEYTRLGVKTFTHIGTFEAQGEAGLAWEPWHLEDTVRRMTIPTSAIGYH